MTGELRKRLLGTVHDLAESDPITRTAFKTYDSEFDGICAALIEHVETNARLQKSLTRLTQPHLRRAIMVRKEPG